MVDLDLREADLHLSVFQVQEAVLKLTEITLNQPRLVGLLGGCDLSFSLREISID